MRRKKSPRREAEHRSFSLILDFGRRQGGTNSPFFRAAGSPAARDTPLRRVSKRVRVYPGFNLWLEITTHRAGSKEGLECNRQQTQINPANRERAHEPATDLTAVQPDLDRTGPGWVEGLSRPVPIPQAL